MLTSPASKPTAYAYYVIVVLVLVNTVNFIDRTAISILMPAIQQEFGFSDTTTGLVMGIAFTAFYATLGFPIARLVDRRSRTAILSVVLLIWSGMTALCGAAANVAQLFLFRIGVGIGEAGAGPGSHSLIADYFAKKDRPMAIGLFSLGVPMGNFLGLALGGYLVGEIGWRWTFVALGAPGILLAALVILTIREPKRGGMDDAADAALRPSEDIRLWPGIKALWASPTFRVMSFSAAPSALCGYGMNLWMPQFISRIHEIPVPEFSLALGAAIGVGGGLGAMSGGALTARAAQRDARAFLTLPALTMVIFAVALGIAVWTNSLAITFAATFVAAYCQFYLMGPFFAVVQRLAPLNGRAVATAFFFFILASVGLGIGPAYVGRMSDMFQTWYGEAEGLRMALMTLPAISLISAAIAWLGRNAIRRDIGKIGGTIPA